MKTYTTPNLVTMLLLALSTILTAVPVASQTLDFGDAPDPSYPTLLSSNGARHVIVPGFQLGVSNDREPNGQPNATAMGDDTDGNDDDDGVAFITPLLQGGNATVDVLATAAGILNAWLDFNNDGDWDDSGEQIFSDRVIAPGLNSLSFHVPYSGIEDVATISRLRFSSVGGLFYTGEAPDGEVEDYMVDVHIPVELSSFHVTSLNGAVEAEWVTQSETENMGFHLYRSESKIGVYHRLTTETIPGAGNSESENRYRYLDQTVEVGKTYYYKLEDVNYNGTTRKHGPEEVTVTAPNEYVLDQNYPNPFNPTTSIRFSLKVSGHVKLTVYNMLGQVIQTLMDNEMPVGSHTIEWNGLDNTGNLVPNGIYIYKIEVNNFKATRKMAVTK